MSGDMDSKTCEAIGRLEAWAREYGSRSQPQTFLDDLKTVIQAAQNEQRAELVRRFALALVATDNYGLNKVWEWATKLADAEPSSNP